MKKRIFVTLLVICIIFVLSACRAEYAEQTYTATTQLPYVDNYQHIDVSYLEISYEGDSMLYESTYPLIDANNPLLIDSDNTSNIQFSTLQERMFIHEGDKEHGGGDELAWYYVIFGSNVNGICGTFIHFVGDDVFRQWTHQFIGHGPDGYAWRNSREANFLSFIEDFGLTKQELIKALETVLGMPIYELDALVNWGRYGTHSFEEEADASLWASMYSLSDLDALFSNDIYTLWTTFPGPGVFHNGNVYSPEWILNNMDQAISDEQIPLHEIDRILGHAVYHPELDEVRFAAETTLQAVR